MEKSEIFILMCLLFGGGVIFTGYALARVRTIKEEKMLKEAFEILREAFATGDYSKCWTDENNHEKKKLYKEYCDKYKRWTPGILGPQQMYGKKKFLIGRTIYKKCKKTGEPIEEHSFGFGYD